MLSLPIPWVWTALAVAYHLASRLAYVIGVGVSLFRQDRYQSFTRGGGVEAGFRRFRRLAAFLMNNDAVSFVVLCLVTRGSLPYPIGSAWSIVAGLACIGLGLGVKLWAAARLGSGAYYWRNFFFAEPAVAPNPLGPYRYLKDPMYTVGYLHAYGFALITGSLPGLLAAAFDQIAILLFHQWVEKPHFERLTRGSAPRPGQGPM